MSFSFFLTKNKNIFLSFFTPSSSLPPSFFSFQDTLDPRSLYVAQNGLEFSTPCLRLWMSHYTHFVYPFLFLKFFLHQHVSCTDTDSRENVPAAITREPQPASPHVNPSAYLPLLPLLSWMQFSIGSLRIPLFSMHRTRSADISLNSF